MVVLPWKQRGDGFVRYHWSEYPVLAARLRIPHKDREHSTVAELKKLFASPVAMSAAEVWGSEHPAKHIDLFVHHRPIAGLFIAWASETAPALEQLATFVPEDWDLP